MTGCLGHSCSLECHCCLLVTEANSGSKGKSPPGAVRTPTYSVSDMRRLPCACFESG